MKHKYFKRDLLPYVFHSNITTYLPPNPLLKIAKAAPPDLLLSNRMARARGKRNPRFLVTTVQHRRLEVQETLPLPPSSALLAPSSCIKRYATFSSHLCYADDLRSKRPPLLTPISPFLPPHLPWVHIFSSCCTKQNLYDTIFFP